MTRPRDARGRFAPRYLPAPDWTLLHVGVDYIAAEPEPLTRQVLPPRKAPTALRGMEWTVRWPLLAACAAPIVIGGGVVPIAIGVLLGLVAW